MTHRTWVSCSNGKDSTPALAAALVVRVGDVVERDGFVFADVLPVASGNGPVN